MGSFTSKIILEIEKDGVDRICVYGATRTEFGKKTTVGKIRLYQLHFHFPPHTALPSSSAVGFFEAAETAVPDELSKESAAGAASILLSAETSVDFASAKVLGVGPKYCCGGGTLASGGRGLAWVAGARFSAGAPPTSVALRAADGGSAKTGGGRF